MVECKDDNDKEAPERLKELAIRHTATAKLDRVIGNVLRSLIVVILSVIVWMIVK